MNDASLTAQLQSATPAVESERNPVSEGNSKLAEATTEVRLADGRLLRLPTSMLMAADVRASQESYDLSSRTVDTSNQVAEAEGHGGISTIPLIEESLVVGRRTVETAKIRLQRTVHEYDQALNESLAIRTFDVERVLLNKVVDAAPAVRHDGDTTIYSLVEERLILTKELVLKEEIHVTQRDTERLDTQVVTLRREHMDIERSPVEEL